MKRYLLYALIAVSALSFVACEQEVQRTYPDNGELPIFRGYMQFSTEVSTRSDLATNMRGRDFGVLGYSYSYTTDWDAAKKLATPDIFYNQQVSCGDNGICTYDIDNNSLNGNQLKPWDAIKWYTFFAYSPYDGEGISLSADTATNTPYLTYEYAWLDKALQDDTIDLHNEPSMFDLVTAQAIDHDGLSNVGLNFKHRLFAIEVLANNYNETLFQYVYDETKPVWVYETDANGDILVDAEGKPIIKIDPNTGDNVQATNEDGSLKYEVKLDENGKKVIDTDADGNPIVIKDATQTISDLVLKIKGLTNNKMTFPLEGNSGVVCSSTQDFSDKTITFNISDYSIDIPAFNEPTPDGRGEGVATSISKLSSDKGTGYVMLIPETAELDFTVDWAEASSFTNIQNTFNSDVDFEAGKLYQIFINFVGSGITIALIEAGAWDYVTVTHTFE